MKFDPKTDLKRLAVVCLAALVMAVNIKSFVRTGGLYPGGATGLTILIQRAFELYFHIDLPYTLINIILNAIPIYIGFKFIGIKFTLFSLIMILMNGFFVDIIPSWVITEDTLLIAIFGGIINGVAISMCLAVDATSGGTDFIAIFLSQKKGIDSFNIIMIINVIILGTAGYMFGWDKALYSIVFQYASTQILHLLYRNYQKQTLFIVTNQSKAVCDAINRVSNHGATVMEGQGSYEHSEREVVYSVIAGSENHKVMEAVREADPSAFINSIKSTEIAGRFVYRPKD